MGNQCTGLYDTLEQSIEGRKEKSFICLAPSLVLFPIGQSLHQRSYLCSGLHHLAPAVDTQPAGSQTLKCGAISDTEIAGGAMTDGVYS